jgi:hypothetical protein
MGPALITEPRPLSQWGVVGVGVGRISSPASRRAQLASVLRHRQHHPEARVAPHHSRIGLRRARERHCLDHRTDARQRAKDERVL